MPKPIEDSNNKAKNAYHGFTNAFKKKLAIQPKLISRPLKINMSFNRALKKVARPKIK